MTPGVRGRSRRALLRLLALGVCGSLAGAACRRRAPNASLAERLLAVAEEAGYGGGEKGTSSARAELERIARQVEAARAGGLGRADALNRVVFEELGFNREIQERGGRFMLLPPVLQDRRGSCVGLGTLYLALAERLGWAAHGVLVPGHFFVRVEEAAPSPSSPPRSVELLRRGEAMPESWYREKYAVPEKTPAAYLRPLSAGESLAVVHFNLGNEERQRDQLESARVHYAAAVQGFPEFPEAQASLGLALHLLGRLPEARAAYQRAARLHPTLPGLDGNVKVLEEELSRGK